MDRQLCMLMRNSSADSAASQSGYHPPARVFEQLVPSWWHGFGKLWYHLEMRPSWQTSGSTGGTLRLQTSFSPRPNSLSASWLPQGFPFPLPCNSSLMEIWEILLLLGILPHKGYTISHWPLAHKCKGIKLSQHMLESRLKRNFKSFCSFFL